MEQEPSFLLVPETTSFQPFATTGISVSQPDMHRLCLLLHLGLWHLETAGSRRKSSEALIISDAAQSAELLSYLLQLVTHNPSLYIYFRLGDHLLLP